MRPAAKPAATKIPPESAARIRELEEQVRQLRVELSRLERESQIFPEEVVLGAPELVPEAPVAVEVEDSVGRKKPVARPKEEELPFEDYDEEEDLLGVSEGMQHRRRELDRERADRELELGDEPFWWVCPKCGEHLGEHEFDSIKVERCEICGTLCIDKGEIDLLLLFSEDDRALAFRTRGLLQ